MTSRTTTTILSLLAVTTLACGADEAQRLHDLFEQRHAWEMREFPEKAMRKGDYTHADRITDSSLAAIERRHRETQDHYAQLKSIDSSRLGEEDLVSYELFELLLGRQIEGHHYRMFLAPVGQRWGTHQTVAEMAERVRFQSLLDYEHYLDRLMQVPQSIDNAIELMRLGLAEGRTPPRITLEGVPGQVETLLAEGGLDSLREPIEEMPAHLDDAERTIIRRRFENRVLPAVREALEKLHRFIIGEYLPNARATIAAKDLPDGKAYYQHQLRTMTTTDMTADEIHGLGLAEVARIRSEMMDVIRRTDFLERHAWLPPMSDEDLFAAFLGYLRTDDRFYYDDPAALLAGYRDICKKVDGHLPHYFRTLPRLPYGVKPIPDFMAPHQTTAYYSFGSIENAQSGTFFANTYALDQRPKYEMIPLAMHEAVPGHHLQSSLARELEGMPEFRRDAWFTAFGEGWALYSERLGIEMGLYEDPYDDFGRLLYEMWRACRLVVDTGIHAKGWTRDEAIGFMAENTALSELNIINEVDRYIAWPGQATAYKIGELKIRSLREQAEKALGAGFDIRAFHDVVLGAGSVPLTVLERRVEDWLGGLESSRTRELEESSRARELEVLQEGRKPAAQRAQALCAWDAARNATSAMIGRNSEDCEGSRRPDPKVASPQPQTCERILLAPRAH